MPGLAGLISLDGTESDGTVVTAMLHAMPHRGARTHLFQPCPSVTLGFCSDSAQRTHMAINPNGVALVDGNIHAGLPVNDPPDQEKPPTAPTHLLAAFSIHQHALFSQLVGEFAIVLWDTRHQELTLARDAFGKKPLLYHRSERYFAFASEIKGLLALKDISASLNRDRIADFFLSSLEGIDTRSTFFKNIYRIPAGHTCRLNGRSFASTRHWHPNQGSQTALDNDESIDAFATTFDAAVACRYQAPQETGILLSGGLDSCSIAASAAASHFQPLNTFSLVSGSLDPSCEESRMIRLMQSHHAFNGHTISPNEVLNDTPSISTFVQQIENPFAASLLAGPIPLYAIARQQGIQVVLDGVDGDVAASLSGNYPWFLANEFGTTMACRELIREGLHFDEYIELPKLVASFLFRRVTNLFISRNNGLRQLARSFQTKRSRDQMMAEVPLSPSFCNEVQLSDRFRQQLENEHPFYPVTIRDACSHTLTAPYMVAAIERYEEAAASFSIQATHPFMDLRLLRLCFNMPWHLRTHNGIPKWVLRQAMTKRLPKQITDQYKIENIGHWFIDEINRNYLKEHPTPPHWLLETLSDFVRIDLLKKEWGAATNQSNADIPDLVASSIVLGEWLRHHF